MAKMRLITLPSGLFKIQISPSSGFPEHQGQSANITCLSFKTGSMLFPSILTGCTKAKGVQANNNADT
jgi:hypothetical protein